MTPLLWGRRVRAGGGECESAEDSWWPLQEQAGQKEQEVSASRVGEFNG